jgi:NAD(P)-dependent dehydrogenase (short-subunit alcohol dehydrogenase family)
METVANRGRLLEGSVALVTGAGRGIGRGIARELARAGADLVVLGRTASYLEEAVGEVRELGVRALPVVADLLDVPSVERAVAEAYEVFPVIDVLVNNAGALAFSKCWEYDEETYRTIVDTNLTGGFVLCQLFGRRWLAEGIAGRIVNIASVESEVAYPDQAPYAATKGGILTMTKVLAREWGEQGVRVNAIGPGPIDTPISQKFRELSEAGVVFHRLGEPDEIGRAVVFLASDMASFVTGTILYVDGGYMLS